MLRASHSTNHVVLGGTPSMSFSREGRIESHPYYFYITVQRTHVIHVRLCSANTICSGWFVGPCFWRYAGTRLLLARGKWWAFRDLSPGSAELFKPNINRATSTSRKFGDCPCEPVPPGSWRCVRSPSLPVHAALPDARVHGRAMPAHGENGRNQRARALRKSQSGCAPSQAEKYRRCCSPHP